MRFPTIPHRIDKRRQVSPSLASLALGLFLQIGLLPLGNAAELTEDEIVAGAEARIEQHRKADGIVAVVDSTGRPVPGARITIEQTRHAFLFGSNFFYEFPFLHRSRSTTPAASKAYKEHFSALFNAATIPFFWAEYEPRRGEPAHARVESALKWCREHGIIAKGHPLAWNREDPSWLPDNLDDVRRLQLERIEDCVSRFKDPLRYWDVINEVVDYDREKMGKSFAPKGSALWKRVGQIEFARECFAQARRANPAAKLVINDARMDARFERVIEQLVDAQKRPLYDAIGIQSHMHGGTRPASWFWEICERYSRFGVPLHFSEVTILSVVPPSPGSPPLNWKTAPATSEGDDYQAREAVRVYTLLFSHPAVHGVTWWDFTDANSWQEAPAGLLRKDMTPKPVYLELKKLIKGKWWTNIDSGADSRGALPFRGFLGDYRVTVTTSDGTRIEKSFALGKDAANRWVVEVPARPGAAGTDSKPELNASSQPRA